MAGPAPLLSPQLGRRASAITTATRTKKEESGCTVHALYRAPAVGTRYVPVGPMASAPDDISDTEDFFEMSLDNLCVAGLDGYFKRVNPSWTRTLGWTAAELMARPSLDLVHPEDRESTLAARATLEAGTGMGPLTNRYRCKDGSYRWFEWRSVAHPERGLVYAAARDVTEQKLSSELLEQAKTREIKLQRQLTFADRMASVGTLASGVAHEINNPLGSVTANIAMIIEELDRTPGQLPEVREMAADIRDGAERIRKIVLGLATFSRAKEERRAVIDLRPVLELAINMTFNEIRHRARLVRDYGETPLVDADEAHLGQVFINLLINAAQALPEGQSGANEIRVATSTDAEGRAVIEIRDSGAGIPATVIERVFDPFFTTKAIGTGTGLGLSICHTIVTGMGGEISATSEPGHGATFRVVLPRVQPGRRGLAAPAETPQTAQACATVLVVDDEPAFGAVILRVLREHEVTVVTEAKKALELLDAGKHFDIVLSDVMMPEMSGMDFHDELTRRFPEVAERMVFVTGGAFTASANAFLDRVTNARIDKPFDPQQLRDLVQRLLRR